MSLKVNAVIVAGVALAILGAGWYAKRQIGGLWDAAAGAVPDVVKQGIGAAGVLSWEAINIVAHPLDGFGVAPGTFADGAAKWEKSVPWNAQDAANNNDSGINFNLF